LLNETGIAAQACADVSTLIDSLGADTTFVVLSEESVRAVDISPLQAWIDNQPTWSDLPFIVMTRKGGGPESNPSAARLANALGNLTFLERPCHPTTFASIARTVYKARQRQYEARHRLEELNESQEKLATALLAGRLGSWSIDIATETLVTSPLCREIYGLTEADEFTYPRLLEMIHPDDLGVMQEAVRRSLAHGEDYNVEYRTRWPDGSVHWLQVNGRIIRESGGGMRGLVGVAMDVTGRKEAEAALRQSNEWLESRVAERTAELVEEARQREQIRRPAAPGAEDGSDRPADRRHRARLQQPPDGGAEQSRSAAQAQPRRPAHAATDRWRRARSKARRGADPAPAGVCPAAEPAG
jgi:PAS domain S-box-containing protein